MNRLAQRAATAAIANATAQARPSRAWHCAGEKGQGRSSLHQRQHGLCDGLGG